MSIKNKYVIIDSLTPKSPKGDLCFVDKVKNGFHGKFKVILSKE
jgi:hypothetical protein